MLLVEDVYLFNLLKKIKDNKKLFKCTEYKTNKKCQAFIKLNANDKIIRLDNFYNHTVNELKTIREESRKQLQNEIKKSIDLFSIKINKLY